MRLSATVILVSALAACDAPSSAPPGRDAAPSPDASDGDVSRSDAPARADAAAPDASRDDASDDAGDARAPEDVSSGMDAPIADDASPTLDAPPAVDAPLDVAPDAPRMCGDSSWIRAVRAPRTDGASVVALPGVAIESVRARFDASPRAMALLDQARATTRAAVLTLPTGDAGLYQVVASRALAAALVAWHDRDATAARKALDGIAAAAIAPEWLITAQEIPIRVGASLVDLAGAADLLAATSLPGADVATARANVGRAASSVDAWLRAGGWIFVAGHRDNHVVRMGSGLVAAGLISSAVSDDAFAYGLTMLDDAIHDGQTGGVAGWSEGSTYFSYAFEVAPVALAALDAAWQGADSPCVRCTGYPLAQCTEGMSLHRPSTDPLLSELARWGASLESVGGWLHPFDDSRITGIPSPLLERVGRVRTFRHWSATGPVGSVGGSVNVGPFVALALATETPATPETPRRTWSAAGTARLESMGTTALEAFLLAEHGVAARGFGHERPDTLSLVLAADGVTMLAASGYGSYDTRAPYATASSASVITVDGLLPTTLGAGEAGPNGDLIESPDGSVTGTMTGGGVTVRRALSIAPDALTVQDTVSFTGAPREFTWHWHLRGMLDPTALSWSDAGHRCRAEQTGITVTPRRESAMHIDGSTPIAHPVLRETATVAPGEHTLTTRIVCARM